MNIKLTMEIGPDDLKSIVAEYLDKLDYGANVDDIRFIVGTEYRGHGPMEHEVHYFDKAVVNVERRN